MNRSDEHPLSIVSLLAHSFVVVDLSRSIFVLPFLGICFNSDYVCVRVFFMSLKFDLKRARWNSPHRNLCLNERWRALRKTQQKICSELMNKMFIQDCLS